MVELHVDDNYAYDISDTNNMHIETYDKIWVFVYPMLARQGYDLFRTKLSFVAHN